MRTCPNCGHALLPEAEDNRTVSWRVRVRLYRDGFDAVQADSDPDTPPDQLGDTVLRGLPAVADHLQALALGFHDGAAIDGVTLGGLRIDVLLHRLKALRPTLSRKGGAATWRVPYTVAGAAWTARVDVRRVET